MIVFCPRCGTRLAYELGWEFARTSVRCSGCGLALEEPPSMLAPSAAEVGYDLSEWPVTDRVSGAAALADLDFPYRWEEDLVLVVPSAVEGQVDGLLAGLQSGGVSFEPEEQNGADGGEEAQTAMADLYVAADRLKDDAYSEGAASDFLAAAAAVGACLPPYGIERQVWQQVQDLAAVVIADVEKQDDAAIITDARTLRDFLRQYV
jgi:hypothetical protein